MDDTQPPAGDDPISALTADFLQTGRALFAAGNVEDTLTKVVELAVATIEGCAFAGVFLVVEGRVTTGVHTDTGMAEVDALQIRTGEGPCLDAIAGGLTFYAEDLATDFRWPRFGPVATEGGVRSVLALPLLGADSSRGALNLYAYYPGAFGIIDRARGLILASLAALALSTAQSHSDEERRAANLRAAVATREIIGQAIGILMERERIPADQAFDVLRRASQHLKLKLREVAQTLVDTGESPDTGPPPS